MSFDKAVNMFTSDINGALGVPHKNVVTCLGLSKMSVPDENIAGPVEYASLRYVELLEGIVRIAYMRQQNKPEHYSWSTGQKVRSLLETLLPFFGFNYEEPDTALVYSTESDDDY